MLPLGQRVAFSIFAVLTLILGARGFYRVFLRIARGRRDTDGRYGNLPARLWYAITTTLAQSRVFRRRRALSVFHSFIFYAFVLYLLVNLVDAVDGFYELRPVASPVAMGIYGFLADAFSILAIVGVIAFILRRFLFKSRRDFSFNRLTLLQPKVSAGYIKQDSLIVSIFILFHVGSRIIGNAARLAGEGPARAQPFSTALAPLFAPHALVWRVFGYWGALGSVLLFLAYFPYTKHIHLLIAPLKYFFRRDAGSGELPPVKIDLEAAEPQLGAAHLADLSWPRLLDAYACIQCNRCQDVCPASQTGKALSPAALEINKRMVLNTIAGEVSPFALTGTAAFERDASAGPRLLKAVISPEAVWACTTCGACMEVCPTQDEQMLDIVDIRRNLVMLEGEFPPALQNAFRGMERTSNPWAISRDKRMEWAGSLSVPTVDQVPDPDVLYWVGCAASYDPTAQKTARAVVQLLTEAHVKFAVLGKRESCTGDTARRAGNELLYQEMAAAAVQTLNDARPRLVLASCPHCVNTIASEYPQFGGNFTVMHHTEYLDSLLQQGKLRAAQSESRVTFHDPCYLGRHRGTYEQPRSLLKILSNDYVELDRTKSNSFCCGAGGAQFWKEEEPGLERISENRFKEVRQTLDSTSGEKVLAVGCPFCKSMLQSTPSAADTPSIIIKDVAELLWEGVQRAKGSRPASLKGASEAADASTSAEATAHNLHAPGFAPVQAEVRAPLPDQLLAPRSTSPQQADVAPSNAPPPEQSTTKAIERKKWAPKGAAAPMQPEPQPRGVDMETSAPAPQLPQQPAPEPQGSPESVTRKKWIPKGTSALPPAQSSEPVSTTTPQTDAVQPVERKKWAPKSVSATPAQTSQPEAMTGPTAAETESTQSEPGEGASPPLRKKWQPKGSG